MNIILYIKLQFKLLLFLISLLLIPLILFYFYSPYKVEGIQYFFLIFLGISKISFFNNAPYKRMIEDTAKKALHTNLGRVPSKNEIIVRVQDYANARDFIIGVIAVCIFISVPIMSFIK